jgi:hypothetical protein
VRVTLKPPPRPDRTLAEVTVTALLATEPHPPAGEDPLEWLLLTNLPVESAEQAAETLSWYLWGNTRNTGTEYRDRPHLIAPGDNAIRKQADAARRRFVARRAGNGSRRRSGR